jgi:hypothetical protein
VNAPGPRRLLVPVCKERHWALFRVEWDDNGKATLELLDSQWGLKADSADKKERSEVWKHAILDWWWTEIKLTMRHLALVEPTCTNVKVSESARNQDEGSNDCGLFVAM